MSASKVERYNIPGFDQLKLEVTIREDGKHRVAIIEPCEDGEKRWLDAEIEGLLAGFEPNSERKNQKGSRSWS